MRERENDESRDREERSVSGPSSDLALPSVRNPRAERPNAPVATSPFPAPFNAPIASVIASTAACAALASSRMLACRLSPSAVLCLAPVVVVVVVEAEVAFSLLPDVVVVVVVVERELLARLNGGGLE